MRYSEFVLSLGHTYGYEYDYSEPSSRFASFDRDDPWRSTSTSSKIKESEGEEASAIFFLPEKCW